MWWEVVKNFFHWFPETWLLIFGALGFWSLGFFGFRRDRRTKRGQ